MLPHLIMQIIFFRQYDVIFHYQKSFYLAELYLPCSVSTIFLYNLQKMKVERNYHSFKIYSNFLCTDGNSILFQIYIIRKFYICYSFRMIYFFIVQFGCCSIIKTFINDLSWKFFVLEIFRRIYIPSIFHFILFRFKDNQNQNHYLSFFTTCPLQSY